ncbi:MAG: hypothetical protein E6J83_05775 [Deltaproteobacteria bacterium]|nr:MAG: hypothetical protein E6J83_05775 [Deltaproteobacteria bacterium]
MDASRESPTRTPAESLEEHLRVFMAQLGPDLDRLRRFAPRFVSLFTETALAVIVLEHVLRKKGMIAEHDLSDGLGEALEVIKRLRARAVLSPAGRA